MAHYYVIKQYSENSERKTPANYPYEDAAQAERQFNLMCAAVWQNEINKDSGTMNVDWESVEMGTVEQGGIKGKRLYKEHIKTPQPEPEPEEPEEEPAE